MDGFGDGANLEQRNSMASDLHPPSNAATAENELPAFLFGKGPSPRLFASTPMLTSFERAILIGLRAEQLEGGEEPRLECFRHGDYDPLKVSEAELDTGFFPPTSILRCLPDGTPIRCAVSALLPDRNAAYSMFDGAQSCAWPSEHK